MPARRKSGEVVINAVVHADYVQRGAHRTRVFVVNDRIATKIRGCYRLV